MNIVQPKIYNQNECSICLVEYSRTQNQCLLVKCGHVFHEECLMNWVKYHANCPACRFRVAPWSFEKLSTAASAGLFTLKIYLVAYVALSIYVNYVGIGNFLGETDDIFTGWLVVASTIANYMIYLGLSLAHQTLKHKYSEQFAVKIDYVPHTQTI